jgi:trimeric autotransporter adhesin
MNRNKQQALRVAILGFFLGAVGLSPLILTSTASAQCGPAGPAGARNTAFGTGALISNTNITGCANSASGAFALFSNTTGYEDSASGVFALGNNTTGSDNAADGAYGLYSNITGYQNTASGAYALLSNTRGAGNTASGAYALLSNTRGNDNTAFGAAALYSNITGHENSASGFGALYSNTTGYFNTASGAYALISNTTGFGNTASGYEALLSSTTGASNIGIGYFAGSNIVAGSDNIDIGNSGTSDESNTIRIGTQGTQSATYIAGISAAQVTGNVVEVNSNGQLGIAMSSARYKHDIHDMGNASAGLMKLRPVTFRYKSDPSYTLQYGLVAEEVAKVYPALVTRGPDGKVQSVRYLELTALLLNQLQKQQREIDALKQQNASINALSARLAALEQQARTAYPVSVDSLARK